MFPPRWDSFRFGATVVTEEQVRHLYGTVDTAGPVAAVLHASSRACHILVSMTVELFQYLSGASL